MEMNKKALEDFFYWINERHNIFLEKEAGKPQPWSEDPIFQQWKFCNPFRTNDTGTRFLIKNVIEPHVKDNDNGRMMFNIFAYRAFNLPETFSKITGGENWVQEFYRQPIEQLLTHCRPPVTSGAYMLRGREGMPKIHSILQTLQTIWVARNYFANWNDYSMQDTYKVLDAAGFWGWGPFTLYQVILDMTYSPILPNPSDINEWCVFGPGAKRGLKEIWPEAKGKDYLPLTKELLNMQGMHLKGYMPIMNLQDIEFSLCELSKYRRIKAGGKGKERYNGATDA